MRTEIKYLIATILALISGLDMDVNAQSIIGQSNSNSAYSIEVTNIDNQKVPLETYKGSVALIVNTASRCGFTPQYKDLQALYEKYKSRGFVVLGFPSNDFMSQEPGSNDDIKRFCSANYGVNFPMFTKGSVKGPEKQPLYKILTEQSGSEFQGEVGWNFEKFLVDRNGRVRARFGSFTNPMSAKLERKVEELLAEPKTSS